MHARGPVVAFALAIVLAVVVHSVAAVSPYDDAFITFRYVHNVAEGRGAVYNTGERVFGISTPLYGAWLTLLHLSITGVELPVLAARSNLLFLVAAGLFTWLLLIRLGHSRWMAAIAGSAIVLSEGILRASIGGMESSMFLALAILSALCSQTRRDGWALLLACLVALVRPEGILLAVLVILVRLADPETRSLPLRLWLASLPLVLWVLAATLYYGTPIPHSIIAKSRPLYVLPAGAAFINLIRHAGEWTLDGFELLARAVTDRAGLALRWDRILSAPVLIAVGALVTAWGLIRRSHVVRMSFSRAMLLPAFLVCILVFYAITNPYLLPWYFPLVHAPWLIVVLTAAARGKMSHAAPAGTPRRVIRRLVTTMVCLAAFVPTLAHLAPSDWSLMSRGASSAKQSEILDAYRRTAAWVVAHSDATETVAAPEIRMLGYHMDRKVLDACGLVTPEAIPFLPVPFEQRGNQQGVISVDFVRATSPDLVVTLPTFARPSLLRSEWFSTTYELVHEEKVLHGAGEEQGVLVFRHRRDPAGAPVARR